MNFSDILRTALHALRGVDPAIAETFERLLTAMPAEIDGSQLSLDDFDEEHEAPVAVTAANVHHAVHLGCVRRLLGMRRDAMGALRRGFVRVEDLSVQLAALGSSEGGLPR